MNLNILFAFLIFSTSLFSQTLINFKGQDIYINGTNVPWNAFGNDMGSHHQWGTQYDSLFFENLFIECEDHNVNTVRLWIHCDGRANPEFDNQGKVTGLDPNFFTHLDDIFARALDHDLYLILTLWSFDMLKDYTSTAGSYAGMHKELISDTIFTNTYIQNALIPIVQHYENQCNLLAYEIINEPEWGIVGNPYTFSTVDQTVTAIEMKRFVGMLAAAIHQNSDHLVTVGASTLAFNSTASAALDHYWNDTAMFNATQNQDAYMDFYQVHFWEWMMLTGHNPFNTTFTDWALDKPTIIGEYPGTSNFPLDNQQTLAQSAYIGQWAGIIPWSYNAQDGRGEWDDHKNVLMQVGLDHPLETEIMYCKTLASNKTVDNGIEWKLFPNPSTDLLNLSSSEVFGTLNIIDVNGKIMRTIYSKTNSIEIDISQLEPGYYLIRMQNETWTDQKTFIKY
jgi:hypothetical protein